MGMMKDGGTSSSIKPPHHVLNSLPLLVFEYEDVDPDSRHDDDDDSGHEHEYDVDDSRHQEDDGDGAPIGMLMYSLSQRRIYTGERPDAMAAKGNTCFSTPQGWVLVVGEASDAWLWHPLAGDTITLPPIHDDHYIPINCKCLLTDSSAAHPDCAVVLLDVADPVMWFCKVSGGSDRRWGQHTYDIGDYQLPEEFRTPSTRTKAVIAEVAALRGRLHFTSLESRQEKMCIVDLGFPPDHGHPPTAQFRRFDVPDVHKFPQDMCSGTIFLVESLDELFAVCICYVDFDVENIGAVLVYKMDFSGDESQEPLGWRLSF
nr:unnamed protein product [Digitaria exilis]